MSFVPVESSDQFCFSGPFMAKRPGRCAWSGQPFGTIHRIRMRLRPDANGVATIPDGAILDYMLSHTSTRGMGTDVFRMDVNAEAFAAAFDAAQPGAQVEIFWKSGSPHTYTRTDNAAKPWRKGGPYGALLSAKQAAAQIRGALFFRPVRQIRDGVPAFEAPAPVVQAAPAPAAARVVRPLAEVLADLAAADKEVELFHPAFTRREMTDADRAGLAAIRARVDQLHDERFDAV